MSGVESAPVPRAVSVVLALALIALLLRKVFSVFAD
jgi:hypothetical protein